MKQLIKNILARFGYQVQGTRYHPRHLLEARFIHPLVPPGRFDLLQIDTEGAGAYILSLFPLDRIRPAIIQREVKHLTTHGYRIALSGDENMSAVTF